MQNQYYRFFFLMNLFTQKHDLRPQANSDEYNDLFEYKDY